MKIKFDKYRVAIKGRFYCILIPKGIEQLWVHNCSVNESDVYWDGNRETLAAILYSCAVLGFDPNKIVYFPGRNNSLGERYRYRKGGQPYIWNGKEEDVTLYDLVLLNHHIQFPRHQWKRVRKMIAKQRPETYIPDYREERTENYFLKSLEKARQTEAHYRKEWYFEELRGRDMFYIFSRMQFRQLYLDIHAFLQRDLEEESERWFQEEYWTPTIPFQCNTIHGTFHRHPFPKKTCFGFEFGFYDRMYDETYGEIRKKILKQKQSEKEEEKRDGSKY